LLTTQTQAYVWSYASSSSSPEVFTFTIPSPSSRNSDPAPLGCLVPSSASNGEPGLIVIVPSSGRIAYWESASSASTQDIYKSQKGAIEGQVKLLSGEIVSSITNAEPAGFILGLSGGRLAHLNVRDAQGQPSLPVQILRIPNGNTGLFSGIRNVFGGVLKRDLAAVRAGRSRGRGEREISAATVSGVFHRWALNRVGQYHFIGEIDLQEALLQAVRQAAKDWTPQSHDRLVVLDFEIIPRESSTALTKDSSSAESVLVLTHVTSSNKPHYALVEVSLDIESARILKVHSINKANTPTNPENASLRLPAPYHTAFVVFSHAVIVYSVAEQANSPSSQLIGGLPLHSEFQDIIEFRQGTSIEIIASGSLDSELDERKDSSCILLVKEGGVIRVNAHGPGADITRSQFVTAKSKLEQAVFFGGSNNLIDFSADFAQFSKDEVAAAAEAVSADILNSTSQFIQILQPSMDQQLKQRKNYAHKLITFLRDAGVNLSRTTRWNLLWAAERLASARAIWKHCDAQLKDSDGDETMVNFIFRSMSGEFRTGPSADKGEQDDTRNWLIYDVGRMEQAVYSAYEAISSEHPYKSATKMETLEECAQVTELILLTLETAFAFRDENLKLYGLEDEGTGSSRYSLKGLPLPWTSSEDCFSAVQQLPDYNLGLLGKYWPVSGKDSRPETAVVYKIADLLYPLEELLGKVTTQGARWMSLQSDPALQSRAREIMGDFDQLRKGHLYKMVQFGKSKEAMKLAETYSDFEVLCDLLDERRQDCSSLLHKAGLSETEKAKLNSKLTAISTHEDRLFEEYGESFSNAFFAAKVSRGQIASLLEDAPRRQELYNKWVEQDSRWWKLKWINDVERKNPGDASRRMMNYALGIESNLWSKKIELSLGKLTQMLAAQKSGTTRDREWLEEYDKKIQNVEIQENVYNHVLPFVRAGTDEDSEVQLAMAQFGKKLPKSRKASRSLIESGLRQLLRREAMTPIVLIDLLTLMDTHIDEAEPGNMLGFEFSYALRVLERSMLKGYDEHMVLRMIWRRCFIRDNWVKLNETKDLSDEALQQILGATTVGKTLQADQQLGLFISYHLGFIE
jgi:nuclear pore complex protein Nup133